MDKTKIHPLVILNLFINAIAMGMFAYDKYSENQIGYSITFTVLFVFFVSLIIYGLASNSNIDRIKNKGNCA
jgi:type IV secretory pathway TrbL component